jgi:hypothetical protein
MLERELARRSRTIECWENQYPGYTIEFEVSGIHVGLPQNGLAGFWGHRHSVPASRWCLETKSLKTVFEFVSKPGNFTENVVNRILRSVVKDAHPVWVEVEGGLCRAGRNRGQVITARHLERDPKTLILLG